MSHKCHAENCKSNIPPRLFMCLKHWKMLPAKLQREVWRLYRPGQETDKQASREYLIHARVCIQYVSDKELGIAGLL